jgi:hypothetical protein
MSNSAILEYRKRVRSSKCRGLGSRTCSRKPGCKYAYKGKTRKFCRKEKNTRRNKLVYYTPKQSPGSSAYATPKSR